MPRILPPLGRQWSHELMPGPFGSVPLATGVLRFCMAYPLLGCNTCQSQG